MSNIFMCKKFVFSLTQISIKISKIKFRGLCLMELASDMMHVDRALKTVESLQT